MDVVVDWRGPAALARHVLAGIDWDGIFGRNYDWGNLVVQAVIALATLLTLGQAIRVNRQRLAFEKKAQAARVSAWEYQRTELPDGTPVDAIPTGTNYDYRDVVERRHICVHNGSDAPVYDVAVRYFDLDRPGVGDAEEGNSTWLHAMLPPGEAARTRSVSALPSCGVIAEDTALAVEFRDASGRYWTRDSSGTLKRRSHLDKLSAYDHAIRRRKEIEGHAAEG